MFRLSLALLVEDTRNHSVAFSPGHYVKYGLRFTDEGQLGCGNQLVQDRISIHGDFGSRFRSLLVGLST